MNAEKVEKLLKDLAYINLKCMQAKGAGVFDEVEKTCLWNALDAIHHELLLLRFPYLEVRTPADN
jgi:hypothetical protein